MDMWQSQQYGVVTGTSPNRVHVKMLEYGGKTYSKEMKIPTRSITSHRIGRKGTSPNPKHISDTTWNIMALEMYDITRKKK